MYAFNTFVDIAEVKKEQRQPPQKPQPHADAIMTPHPPKRAGS